MTLDLRDKLNPAVLPLFDQLLKEAEDLYRTSDHAQTENANAGVAQKKSLRILMRAGHLLRRARKLAVSSPSPKIPWRPLISVYEKKRLLTLTLRDKLKPHIIPLFDQLVKEADDLYMDAEALHAAMSVDGRPVQKALNLKKRAGNQLLKARKLTIVKLRPVYKTCTKCHKRRRQASFHRLGIGLNEVRAICKKCTSASQQAWKKSNPSEASLLQRRNDIKNHLEANFGMSLEQFEQLFAKSDGLCQICKRPERRKRRLSLDHDHATGRLRGFVCSRCNLLLGDADEDAELLERAASYLRTADLGVILSKGRSVPLAAQIAPLREAVRGAVPEFSVERHLAEVLHAS